MWCIAHLEIFRKCFLYFISNKTAHFSAAKIHYTVLYMGKHPYTFISMETGTSLHVSHATSLRAISKLTVCWSLVTRCQWHCHKPDDFSPHASRVNICAIIQDLFSMNQNNMTQHDSTWNFIFECRFYMDKWNININKNYLKDCLSAHSLKSVDLQLVLNI